MKLDSSISIPDETNIQITTGSCFSVFSRLPSVSQECFSMSAVAYGGNMLKRLAHFLNLPERPTCCPSTVAYRWVMLREYPPNGRWGSSVRVMGTEILMGPESSSRRGTWVLGRDWPLVTTMLSGVVDSFRPCFIVSFSDTQKSSSLKRSRKVFQSCKEKVLWLVLTSWTVNTQDFGYQFRW